MRQKKMSTEFDKLRIRLEVLEARVRGEERKRVDELEAEVKELDEKLKALETRVMRK